MLFQVPPPTRFDLNFNLFGFPVRVHPLFWLIAILFGASSNGPLEILLWVFAMFISILIHELGHTFAMRYYGQNAFIILHAMGGLAVPQQNYYGGSNERTNNQQIIISLAGPLAGFLFALLIAMAIKLTGGFLEIRAIFGFLPFPYAQYINGNPMLNSLLFDLLVINILWGYFNLLPVYPLDGGHVSRHVFLIWQPWNGARYSLWLSVITGAAIAIASFVFLQSIYTAILFGMLAFQSYQMLQYQT
jgi:stage IV sporulation protein FB